MTSKLLRAGLAALLSLACAIPASADYLGTQAGGGGNITYGAFSPTIGGVVTQLTKSVPVDPVTGLAVALATSTKQPTFGTAGTPSADVLSIQGVANGTPQPTDTVIRAVSTSRSIIIPVGGVSAAVTAGGSGQVVGDILTVVGGTCTVQPRFNVSAVTSGAATAVTLNTSGSCTVLPASPAATTSSGSGTAATLTPTYASIATQIMAANPARRGLQVQPQGSVAYMNGVGAVTADYNSLKLPADALYESLPQHTGIGAVGVISAGAVPLPVYAREF